MYLHESVLNKIIKLTEQGNLIWTNEYKTTSNGDPYLNSYTSQFNNLKITIGIIYEEYYFLSIEESRDANARFYKNEILVKKISEFYEIIKLHYSLNEKIKKPLLRQLNSKMKNTPLKYLRNLLLDNE